MYRPISRFLAVLLFKEDQNGEIKETWLGEKLTNLTDKVSDFQTERFMRKEYPLLKNYVKHRDLYYQDKNKKCVESKHLYKILVERLKQHNIYDMLEVSFEFHETMYWNTVVVNYSDKFYTHFSYTFEKADYDFNVGIEYPSYRYNEGDKSFNMMHEMHEFECSHEVALLMIEKYVLRLKEHIDMGENKFLENKKPPMEGGLIVS